MKYREYKAIIDAALAKYIAAPNDAYARHAEILWPAMAHSALAPGKRLRPVLLLAATDAFCGDISHAILAACAVEMLHASSLIHDDLPALDNDDLRRGRSTCHVVFGEAQAIVAGDGLMLLAFDLISRGALKDLSHGDRHIRAMAEISHAVGVTGMVAGQSADLMDNIADADKLFFIHKNKTAAMIRAPIVAGGYLGGASDDEIALLRQFGEALGLMFQIQDDILDVLGDKGKLGKSVGKDAQQHKLTYVSLFGLDAAKAYANEQERAAREVTKQLSERGAAFLEIIEMLTLRET